MKRHNLNDMNNIERSRSLSVVIPTLNEAENVCELIRRIDSALREHRIDYEIIFIDDRSKDATREKVLEMKKTFPVSVYMKKGLRGKAHSLVEGFALATKDYIAFIDADLQYPPDALPGMLEKALSGFDIVVSDRRGAKNEGFLRRLASYVFHLIFSKFLHGLDVDTQSGLKLFRTEIAREVTVNASPWTFDLEFLLKARNYGYSMGNYPIVFEDRRAGKSKVVVWKASFEIGWNALKLRFKNIDPLYLPAQEKGTMTGAGVVHKGTRFIVHTTLGHTMSAIHTFSLGQKVFFMILVAVLLLGLVISPLIVGIVITTFLTILYFADNIFTLYLVSKSLRKPPEIESSAQEIAALKDEELPVYTIFCPLYKEAHMLPGFLKAMNAIEWPKEKLDVMLLLEENDPQTVEAAKAMDLPSHVRIVVVPDSLPKTKPKACNYGLNFTKGEYVVIYDAEDIPDPYQLKKAFLAFRRVDPSVRCLQAKLNYFNPKQNLLTRLFTAEYSLWFDVMLPGLQSIDTSIPLGGTSNHFRTRDLLELEGWDPFNVTEDCDLGVRIFKRGYRTAIIESVTLEEANSKYGNWLRQRSRWIKGYIQTYLVHMRHPIDFFKTNGRHAFIFQMVVGGKIISMLINPFLWLITASYFLFRTFVGPAIEALYPPYIFYIATVSLLFGNFLYIYYYMIGAAKRGHFDIVKYVFLVPFYWLMVSIAAFIAAYQLIAKPYYWEKTNHGLHLKKKRKRRYFDLKKPAVSSPIPVVNVPSPVTEMPMAEVRETAQEGTRVSRTDNLRNRLNRIVPADVSRFLLSDKGLYVAALLFGNMLNFIFNAFLGRALSFSELALVTFVNTLWYLSTLIIGPFGATVNHETAYLTGRYGLASAKSFFARILKTGLYVIFGVSLLWLALSPLFADFFNVDKILPLLLFTPVFLLGFLSFSYQGFLQGSLRFSRVAAVFTFEAVAKLCIAIGFVVLGLSEWTFMAIPLSLLCAAFFGWFLFSRDNRPVEKTVTRENFPMKFFFSSMMSGVSVIIFLSVDILLVKHYFVEIDAGQYALLSLIGKMIFFLGSLPASFMITLVSHKAGERKGDARIFRAILVSVFVLSAFGVFLLGIVGKYVVPFLFGDKSLAIVPYLLEYSLAIAFFTLGNTLVLYHLAKRHFVFVYVSLAASLSMMLGIYLAHDSLAQIVRVVFVVSHGNLLALGLFHVFWKDAPFLRRVLHDLSDLFSSKTVTPALSGKAGRRILIFNWRDSRHAYAGGAEVYVEEMAKRWVKNGDSVMLFCGNDGKSPRHEVRDGIDITRRGGFYLVYFWAFAYYMIRFRGKFDLIVDCHNGIPFFTPLYAREPVYCLLHHVHQSVFYRYLPKVLATIACFMEKDLMPLVYRNVPFITVSQSSKSEMIDLGIGKKGISIVHPGVDLDYFVPGEKSESPTVLYLGRLKAYKSVDILIRAFKRVLRTAPEATLIIAGDGDEKEHLKKLAYENLGMSGQSVKFLGFVPESKKKELLQSSWMLVQPSSMEGWGIVAIEASACNTPVIASDVPGLRDSVLNPHSGFLVRYGDEQAFAERITQLILDENLRREMGFGGREWSARFDWDEASKHMYDILVNESAL